MALTPIVELGVAEAYQILAHDLRHSPLPPLDAIENEDWGRDWLLSTLLEYPAEVLARLGLTATDDPPPVPSTPPGADSPDG